MEGKLRAELMGRPDLLRADLHAIARVVQEQAQVILLARSRDYFTGRLLRSIRVSPVRSNGASELSVQIGSDLPYALWVEEGTGVFGPHGTPITPRTAPVMVFYSRVYGGRVVTRNVIGQVGKHFLRNALGQINRALDEL
jgi:hypothetical protein